MDAADLQGDDVTFISYAQNAEDVILFRALGHIANGFYIDVGAQDPVNDSVTRAFYDRGWRGINVEPVQRWFDRLNEDRPDDLNLQLIVADHNGVETISEVVDTGLSTVDVDIARQHSLGGHAVRELQVRATTLDDICRDNAVGTIHFLKVDVEGHEAKVLAGAAFDGYRPWVLLIEATAPNSQVETHGAWEPGVLERGYVFAYADGLNRFYVASEKYEELKDFFRYPPNFFDDYERMPVNWLRRHAERLENDLAFVTADRERLLSQAALPREELSDREMLITLRERFRRLRAERVLMRRQVRQLQVEMLALRNERNELIEEGREAKRYRMQIFVAEERIAETDERVDAQRRDIDNLREYIRALEEQAGNLKAANESERLESARLREQIAIVLRSSSWRLTKPLRVLRRLLFDPAAHGGRRAVLRSASGLVLRTAARVPGIRRVGGAALRRMPRARARLLRLHGLPPDPGNDSLVPTSTVGGLSPMAAHYFLALGGADDRRDASRRGDA